DFLKFLEHYNMTNFTLVEGNHDILGEYPESIRVTQELKQGPFSFTHIKKETDLFNISGHIHPGVTIRGKAKQSITMPCFHFTDKAGLLPAFGQFTGIKKIRPKKSDRVYGIVNHTIIELT
ncbi:MAG: phosphoesterase, partial [Bacteroidota bacterium]